MTTLQFDGVLIAGDRWHEPVGAIEVVHAARAPTPVTWWQWEEEDEYREQVGCVASAVIATRKAS